MACVQNLWAALSSLLIGICLFFLLNINKKAALPAILTANFFLLLIWLLVPWTAPGKIIYRMGFIQISEAGLMLCLLATLKANAILLTFLAIMNGTTPMKLGLAFAQIHLSPKLALMIVFSAQQIEILKTEWKTLRNAAKLKAFQTRFSFHSWKTIAAMLAILLVRASDKAESLHEALLLRGFSGKFPLCCRYAPGRMDFILMFSTLLLILAILAINWIDFHA